MQDKINKVKQALVELDDCIETLEACKNSRIIFFNSEEVLLQLEALEKYNDFYKIYS